ncbi:glycoside hydrolase family 92 protein [Fulvivirga sp. M361]|uniref:GH92 family glycosyl hydrolase n=1 Tax=Fulvivirga sp. M361 TaxID=2594266 RepID=UPI00117AB9E3|nr:GH92 family glycosyl hydrolase [Fulvivirga sp. M361]TRX53365.1 glycoside hydrolase family 92 protein [Fulvivirga sp. M361]
MIKKLPHYMIIISIMAACSGHPEEKEPAVTPVADPLQYVDPFIGTAAHGHTFPGATVPFGMVQLSPDNGITGWDWCSGYHYSDSIIVGFSHMHLSGTGIGDLTDIRLMPTSAKVDLTKKITDRADHDYKSFYTHDDERASPGYYYVKLLDHNIDVSLSATTHAGIQQYDFPKGQLKSVVLDLSDTNNWDKPVRTKMDLVNDTLITGYRYSTGWAKDQRVYFAIAFSQPVLSHTFADGTSLLKGVKHEGIKLKAVFDFESKEESSTLFAKTGISSASVEGALKSLNQIKGWDFEKVKKEAEAAWRGELNKVAVTSDDEVLKRTFYTALYHTNLAPVIYSDLNNEYKGVDGNVHKAEGYTRYDIFSLWDTFRAANPLLTVLQPDKVDDMINSMLAHYKEYGLLPVWSLLGNETNTMTGYHAIPVISDAYLKGFTGFDINVAYEAMKASAMQDIRGVNFLKEYGYIPSELEVESVTKTLEYAYDDWCIAQVAKALGKEDDYKYFIDRASAYRKLFDPETKFMRGKLADGSWRTPFDPKHSSHRVRTDYTEGNAWQHSWFVPHDVQGLIELMGGNGSFIEKLDQLFSEDSNITGENISADISGLIGQYAHGNEPSHHIAYLYSYAGAPWKTQEIVRDILLTLYSDQPDGLCGNEDCGQMSAWYVFSALGFYPVNPAEGIYVIGSPVFEKSQLTVAGGKKFIVEAIGSSTDNKYIQTAELNGRTLERAYIKHSEILEGGKLVLTMGSAPNKEWAAASSQVPPSMSK